MMSKDSTTRRESLAAAAKNEERFFGPKYRKLPNKKLVNQKKWSDYAKQKDLRGPLRKAVTFMKDVEQCISGELRFLLEMNDIPERIIGKADEDDIPDLQAYWDEGAHPEGLKETYALFKAGGLPLPEQEDMPDETSSERPRKRAKRQTSPEDTSEQPSVLVPIKTEHLFKSLLQYGGGCPSGVVMTCPFNKDPSSVTIKYPYPNSINFEYVKIEISPGLCMDIAQEHCKKD